MTKIESKLLTTEEAAEILGVHPTTMRDWRHQGNGPRFVKVGQRKVRYRVQDLDAWIEENIQEPTRS